MVINKDVDKYKKKDLVLLYKYLSTISIIIFHNYKNSKIDIKNENLNKNTKVYTTISTICA